LLHHMIPFLWQAIAITLLIVQVARSRARAGQSTKMTFGKILKNQFSLHKELYTTPVIIILSALPQIIVSFSLACEELVVWQKRMLLVVYFISYTPQTLGFVLYVLPSITYRTELEQTFLGTSYTQWISRYRAIQSKKVKDRHVKVTNK
jgi:hypothetical protein